jgi:hypothetical protein
MKVIFLDCDGVINCISPSYTTSYYKPDGSVTYFDEHLIQRLNWLIEKSEADIVISSSWRYDMPDLKEQMELNGFKHWDKVIGYTPTLTHRGEEIQRWLDDNPEYRCYVVLEDEPQDVCGEKCNIISKLFVVEINPEIGLTHTDVQAAYMTLTACERREELK